jgi:hypothetical protein
MLNRAGVTKMDMYLSDYIKRTSEKLNKENQQPVPSSSEHNDYEVWPEENGDADNKRNPYSRV